MILTGTDLREIFTNSEVDPRLIDLDMQIQQSGIDMTLVKIERFGDEPGELDFDNTHRKMPKMIDLPFDSEGKRFLKAGAYKVFLDPVVTIPMDCMAIAQPRSSLTRMGCGIHSGYWDAGYVGNSSFVLTVHNPAGVILHKNARLAQLAYIRTTDVVKDAYSGVYQGQGIEQQESVHPAGMVCEGGQCRLDPEAAALAEEMTKGFGKSLDER